MLKLIASGQSTKEVSRTLGITFKTAACHRSRIMAKLDIHEVASLTRYAIRRGYVDLGATGSSTEATKLELFEQIRTTEAKYQRAMDEYAAFVRNRDVADLNNPDGSTGARRLRRAEEMAHQEYHAALVALKNFLMRD